MMQVSERFRDLESAVNPVGLAEKTALTVIRVSREDQMRGYGPDAQWEEDILPSAAALGLIAPDQYRRVIQEPATDWNRPKFEEAVREAIHLYQAGLIGVLLFPRVDRETRFLFASFPILCDALRSGLQVYFARERFRLDQEDSESVSRYLRKAEESRAYVETMRINTMQGRKRRMERDAMMPTAKSRWAYEYHSYRRDWGQPPDSNSGRFTAITDRVAVVQAWVKWILEEGASLSECQRRTADRFGIEVGRSALSKTLKDPIIIGKVFAYRSRRESSPQGTRNVRLPENEWKLVYEDHDLAIITDEQFQALRVKFQRNKENSPRNVKKWYPPVRGMVFCSSCGKKMSGQTRGGTQLGFRCPPCRRWVKAVPLWDEIQAKVRDIVLQPDLVSAALKSRLDNGEAVSSLESDITEIDIKLTTLKRAEQKLLRFHLYTNDDDERDADSDELLFAEQARIQTQRKELRQQQAESQAKVANLKVAAVDADGIRRFLLAASANLDKWDGARWKILLEALNMKVVAFDDRIDVEISVPSQEEGESVTMYSISPCGRRPIPAASGSTGSTGLPVASKPVPRPGGPSSVIFPMSRLDGSSPPLSWGRPGRSRFWPSFPSRTRWSG